MSQTRKKSSARVVFVGTTTFLVGLGASSCVVGETRAGTSAVETVPVPSQDTEITTQGVTVAAAKIAQRIFGILGDPKASPNTKLVDSGVSNHGPGLPLATPKTAVGFNALAGTLNVSATNTYDTRTGRPISSQTPAVSRCMASLFMTFGVAPTNPIVSTYRQLKLKDFGKALNDTKTIALTSMNGTWCETDTSQKANPTLHEPPHFTLADEDGAFTAKVYADGVTPRFQYGGSHNAPVNRALQLAGAIVDQFMKP